MGLQFIERPDEIPAKEYTSKAAYKDGCAAELQYEASDPSHKKTSSVSGVKARNFFGAGDRRQIV